MLIDIFMLSAFCIIMMAAVSFIKKMPSHELINIQIDANQLDTKQ